MHIRAEYRVGPDLKFLSNLDMMHLMERTLRRAEIPYALTDGFNPHIKLSMGTVLPVGLWGEKEYFDLELTETMDLDEFKSRMNQVLPPDMNIKKCAELSSGTPSLMKIVNCACYSFVIDAKDLDLDKIKDEIMARDQLIVSGRGKKKDIKKDLRPGLYKLKLEKKGYYTINVWVCVGEPVNVRFDELLEMFIGLGIPEDSILDIYRRGNYIKKGKDFYSPLAI